MASEKPDEVVDFSAGDQDACSEENFNSVRLRSGFNIKELKSGVILEIDPELTGEEQKPSESDYFRNIDEDELDTRISKLKVEMEEDDISLEEGENDLERERTLFQRLAMRMENIVIDEGVKKREIRSGLVSEGEVPENGFVTIHYSLYLDDQVDPYDSSVLRGKAERYKMGSGSLIPGMEIAVKSMRKRERSDFLIAPRYAFGSMGCPPRVPGNSTIRAKIDLLDFTEETEADALLSLPIEDRWRARTYDQIEKIVRKEHIEGNSYLEKSRAEGHATGSPHVELIEDFRMAFRRYDRGIRLLEEAQMQDEGEEKRQKHLLLKLYLNRSHCLLKMQMPKKACLDLQKVLGMEPRNAKALYRMGRAKRMLGSNSEAETYLRKAQKMAPNDESIGHELLSLDAEMRRDREAQRKLYRKMITGNSESVSSKEEERDVSASGLDANFFEELESQMKAFVASASDDSLKMPSTLSKNAMAAIRSKAAGYKLVLKEVSQGSRREVWLERAA